MHKQLGLGREVVVDDVVQLRNVDATRRQVCDNHDLDLSLLELGHVDLASRLVQGAVDVGAADATLGQQLSKQPPQSVMSTFFQTLEVKTPQLNQKQVSVSHFSLFNCHQKNSTSFCSFKKGTALKICMLYLVLISFELFMHLDCPENLLVVS